MKKKTLAIFFAALMLVLVSLLWIFAGAGPTHERDFGMNHTDNVGMIEMKKPGEEPLVFERTPDGGWLLNESFHANEPAVRDLLYTMRNQVVRLPVPIADQPEVNRQLDESGVKVNVYEKTHWIRLPGNIGFMNRLKKIKSFYVGENTPDGESTYMRKEGVETPFAVHVPGVSGGIKDVYQAREHVWRDRVVVNLTPSQIHKVEVNHLADPGESFVLDNTDPDGYEMKTTAGEVLDETSLRHDRVERFLSSFSRLSYEKLALDEEMMRMDSLKVEEPFLLMTIHGEPSQEIRLAFHRRKPLPGDRISLSAAHGYDPNRFYLQVNEGDFALAQYYVFNRIMRPLSFFQENFDK